MCVCNFFSQHPFYVNLCSKSSDSSSILLAYRKADLEGTVAQEAGVKRYTVLHGKKDLGRQMENGRDDQKAEKEKESEPTGILL